MLSAGSIYFNSGISISKRDRTFAFQGIENPSAPIEYLVMNLPLEGGYRNTFSNEIAASFPLNVYEKIGTTTRGKSSSSTRTVKGNDTGRELYSSTSVRSRNST